MEFFAIRALKIPVSDFWRMTMDEFYALSYWQDTGGEEKMTMEDLQELKRKVLKNSKN